jgi:hypothetical protein
LEALQEPIAARRGIGPSLDRRAAGACAAIVLLSGLVYLNALHNPFVYDDYHTVVGNSSIANPLNWRAILLHDVARPVVNTSYALDRALWGAGPFGFHLTNVALHMVNVALLFAFAFELAGTNALLVAGSAAVLFGVHPMMSEAVGYISGRSEVLCATWFLVAVWCGRRWFYRRGAVWAALTVAFWGGAVATKEIGAMFPFVLLVCDRLDGQSSAADKREHLLRVHLPLLAVAGLLGLVRIVLFARVEYPGQVVFHGSYLLVALDVLRQYVWLLAVPMGQTIFHEVHAAHSVFEPRALAAVAFLVAAIGISWRIRRTEPLASLGIAWFLLLLVPSTILIVFDRGEPMAEHWAYLAGAGLFLAAGAGIGRLHSGLLRSTRTMRQLAAVGGVAVVLSLGVDTMVRNAVWGSPVGLWRESVDLAPTHYRPRLLLGEALHDEGSRALAMEQFRMAIALRPAEPFGYVKLGQCLAEQGQIDEARRLFLEALRIDPASVPARQSLTILERAVGAGAVRPQ